MAHQPSEPLTVNVKGGEGGRGGLGSGQGQGGRGGDGLGPTLNIGTATVHVQGGAEINIRDRDIIISWLSPINFFLRQADISREREKGTGGWLLADPVFKEWESGSGSTLWCRGIPGAGKTILASMVVDHLSAAFRNNKDIGVACIYLNHKEADQQPPPKLLAGLWRQLVLDREIGSTAESLYKQHREKSTVPSLEEVVSVLRSSITELSKVFIIIDAMDEYPEVQRHTLLKHLAKMGSKVNSMITSRPNISPERYSFQNLKTLDIYAMSEDIQAYIDAQVNLSPRLSEYIEEKPELRDDIHAKIIGAVDGMFLLAKLHLESLSTQNTIKAVRNALKELPKDLHDSYDIAMQRIDAQSKEDRKTAHSTITWVANAKRPLTVEELRAALAVEPNTQQLDKENFMTIKTILSVCAGLVIVDEKLKVVRLVHYTTQEYLDKIQAEKFPDAQTEITHTLLTFLAFDGYPDSSWNRWNLPPLVEYSQYCLAHAAGQPEVQLREILLKFLGQAFQWMQTLAPGEFSWKHNWNSLPWIYPDWPSQPSVLWIAAAANLMETTNFLLERAPLLQHSENPEIIVASYYGHIKIVQILLEKGADVNSAGGIYGSPLHTAITAGHPEIVHILVENGANVNAAGGYHGTPLQSAAAGGSANIVHLLLEQGADVNTAGGEYGSPLYAAIIKGHPDIVRILVKHGADVNAAGGEYGSPLYAAITKGDPGIGRILVENSADVNAAGGEYVSPLYAAIAKGDPEIVRILVENSADVNAAGGDYGSPLYAAISKGHPEIVHILVENSADINATIRLPTCHFRGMLAPVENERDEQ